MSYPSVPARQASLHPNTPPTAIHLQLYRQPNLAGVLGALAQAGRALGAPVFVGCLLRDPGADAWYLTALFDPAARPTPLERIGLPAGPFPFFPTPVIQAQPLASVLGDAWGDGVCAEVERRLGATAALCLPFGDEGAPRGALLALAPAAEQAALLLGVFAHAATAAARHLSHEAVGQEEGILDWPSLARAAEREVARATRYGREVGVVVAEMDSLADLVRVGTALVRGLRPWDQVGRLDGGLPSLGLLLPETGREGIRGLLHRLNPALTGLRTAAAIVPEDGTSFAQVVAFARGRTAVAAPHTDPGATPGHEPLPAGTQIWRRGAQVGPGAETVRCGRCATPYTRQAPAAAHTALAYAREVAQSMVQRDCPHHLDQIVVAEEPAPAPRSGGLLRLWGRAKAQGAA